MLTPAEIEVVLKSLPDGKAVGPDGIVTRFFVNYLLNSHCHSVLYSTSLYRQVCFQIAGRYQMFVPSLSHGIALLYRTIDLFLFYAFLRRFLKELFLNTFTIIFKIIIFSLLFNLDSYQETQLLINLLICMILFHRLLILERW